MKFIQVLRTLQNKGIHLERNSIYMVTNSQAKLLGKRSDFKVLYEIIKPLDIEDNNYTTVLMICGGGIGDIIAFSALCHYLNDKTIYFATQTKYSPILGLFQKKVIPMDINGAILSDYSISNRLNKYSMWRRVKSEYAIVNNNHLDWYDVLFSVIGVRQVDKSALGPKLKQERPNDEPPRLTGKSLLITNKASCMMRTAHFMDIYNCLSDELKKYNIYVHLSSLSYEDVKEIPKSVNVLPPCSLLQFFCDLYDADQVISVDTASVHYREGIGKPAIGLFNSFDKEIRTKFYKHTKSFNLKSECELQPCFKHELNPGDLCPKVQKWQFAAPCFEVKTNKYLKEELKNILT